jgi:peptide/nickel transport system substrate-binding protein
MVFPMWVDTAPFDSNDVREAIKYSIDRQAMVKTVLQGYGVAGDDNPIPPTSPSAWRPKARERNIALAKELLTKAGYGPAKPLKVDLYTADMIPGMVNLAQLFKQQAAEAGIDINVIVGPASEYWDNVWLKHPFQSSGWSARPPGEGLSIAYLKSAPYPETHWKVPQFDAMIANAATTVSAAKRLALYKQAEKMLSLQGGAIIPVFQQTVAASRTNCTGYTPYVQFVHIDFSRVQCTR